MCPGCAARRGEDLADALLAVLPKVPYRHLVVSIPKRMGLRERMREDPSLQPRLVRLATRMLAREMRRSVRLHRHRRQEAKAALPGMIAVLQTWTDRMAWDPHVHLVVADGAWLPDGSFYPYLGWDSEHLTRCLRDSVLAPSPASAC